MGKCGVINVCVDPAASCWYCVPCICAAVFVFVTNTAPSPSSTVGKTLAYTSCRFTNAQGVLVARGSHTKYVALAWRDERNITDELKPEAEREKEERKGDERGSGIQ